MVFIFGGTLITPFRVIKNGNVLIKNGLIEDVSTGVGQDAYLEAKGVEPIDARGKYVAPGFIDMHVHGGGGFGTEDGDEEAIIKMARAHAARGTTGIVPTCSAAPVEALLNAIDCVRAAQGKMKTILGVHLEGPFLSRAQKGAQNESHIIDPDESVYKKLLGRWDKILMMSAAPELPGGFRLGRELASRGVVASVGHSDADFETMGQALLNGYSHVTHLYSGCSTVRRVNAFRVAGVVEAALYHDGFTAEVIADGRHLPASLLKLAHKIKGPGRMALVTDGLRHSASELKEGATFTEGGAEVVYEDGVLKLASREAFAGSVATADALVRNMVEIAGVPLAEAVEMATSTPAKILGLD
ncbi:MAG: N-acetylglucosamine-6-phosphate deacetylase, partial [Defluviitaleaceae bacterium]|nr:N-acetylglucosamine-6-phosphate deacetylase [Defluviitaleaceae bacterium]